MAGTDVRANTANTCTCRYSYYRHVPSTVVLVRPLAVSLLPSPAGLPNHHQPPTGLCLPTSTTQLIALISVRAARRCSLRSVIASHLSSSHLSSRDTAAHPNPDSRGTRTTLSNPCRWAATANQTAPRSEPGSPTLRPFCTRPSGRCWTGRHLLPLFRVPPRMRAQLRESASKLRTPDRCVCLTPRR